MLRAGCASGRATPALRRNQRERHARHTRHTARQTGSLLDADHPRSGVLIPRRSTAGIFGSVLYQLEDDEGGLADRLDGFKGRSYAIGPIITYEAGPKERPINIALSWAPEFGVKNRPKGNAVYLSVSGSF